MMKSVIFMIVFLMITTVTYAETIVCKVDLTSEGGHKTKEYQLSQWQYNLIVNNFDILANKLKKYDSIHIRCYQQGNLCFEKIIRR